MNIHVIHSGTQIGRFGIFSREINVLYREVFMLQISDFFTEVKVAKSSDIARNMLPSITMLAYANRSQKMRPFTV